MQRSSNRLEHANAFREGGAVGNEGLSVAADWAGSLAVDRSLGAVAVYCSIADPPDHSDRMPMRGL